jgi:hypothetical protein
MPNHSLLQNLQVTCQNSGLRFLLMFLGVAIVPAIIFVNSGADASPQNAANLFLQFLTLGGLLFTALLFGWVLFNRKTRSLSIYSPPDAIDSAASGGIYLQNRIRSSAKV